MLRDLFKASKGSFHCKTYQVMTVSYFRVLSIVSQNNCRNSLISWINEDENTYFKNTNSPNLNDYNIRLVAQPVTICMHAPSVRRASYMTWGKRRGIVTTPRLIFYGAVFF